ncbi:MAG: xanthine dehydrogenase family protein molybdopterin-binding subunit, partial [Candidatus Geothermarchaeales archaeon]
TNTITPRMISGCYRIRNVEGEVVGVFTNKAPIGPYRGAGRPEATFAIERIIDRLASKLRIDPAEIRRRNFIQPGEFPYKTATGVTYDTGDYNAALDEALKLVGYEELRRERHRLRKQGRYIGIGLSAYVEITGGGSGDWETARVRVEPSGQVTVYTGVSPHGQGEETSFAQICADALEIPVEAVTVRLGDTAEIPEGVGTFASRSIMIGGTAVLEASREVRDKAMKLGAYFLGVESREVIMDGGVVRVRDDTGRTVSLGEIAEVAQGPDRLPPGTEPGLDATSVFAMKGMAAPFGVHVAVVEVDLETGVVRVKKYVAVDDCGTVINPVLVEGQIHGGAVQGISQALFEEVVYDERGQLLTSSLMDYTLPTSREAPHIVSERTETPSPLNPLGAKGVGEMATIGSTPAIANAVDDALSPLSVTISSVPCTPEVVWKAIQRTQSTPA